MHNGVVSIVFSANASWDNRYCLGLHHPFGRTIPLDATQWTKYNTAPIFSQDVAGWGTGHHTFFTSPDGSEQWIAFHTFNVSNGGWGSREVRAQRIVGWNANNTPNLGSPVADGPFVEPASDAYPSLAGDYPFAQGGSFQIMSMASGKCVDVVDGAAEDGTRVRQWTCNGAAAQKYTFVPVGVDSAGAVYYNIETANAGKCLEVVGASLQSGALLDISTCLGAEQLNQQWHITHLPSGGYTLVARHSGQNLDLYAGDLADDAIIQQWPANGLAPQTWSIRL